MKKLALVLFAVLATVVCAVAPLVVHAAPAPAAALPDYTPPPVQFASCSSPALVAARAQCGFVTVPVDYANPTGATIQLAISRVRHKSPDAQYQGLMLVAPDGPGDSALEMSRLQSRVPNGGGNDYDWIGYDPRGVGASQPTLTCQPDYFATPRPDYTKYEYDALQPWQTRNGAYATSCAASPQSDLFAHLTTRESAYDLDSIRKALDQPKVNLYGFGYGAYAAEVYASLYPGNVRRAVLDSPLDPTETGAQRSKDRSPATDTALKAFFGWIARYDSVYGLGTTADAVQTRWTDTRTELAAANAGETIGPDEWTELFLPAAATTSTWADLAGVFAFWQQQHNPSVLADAFRASAPSDNAYAVRNAVQCTDDQAWPTGDRAYFDDTVDTVARAPLSGAANAWFDAPCSAWPFDATAAVPVNGTNLPPVLIVSETLDALAPYPGSLATRAAFPNARLIEGVGGTTHAASLEASSCITNAVSDYLLTGQLPDRVSGSRSDRQCAPNPQPVAQAGSVPTEYRPGVTTQPQPQSVTEGSSVTFTAAAAGPPAATVQWQVSDDGGDTYTDILGADDESYTLDDATVDRSGNLFRAVFTNTQGQDTSKAALLTVNTVPTITTQPADQTVTAGGTASFAAEADGTPEPTVQWQRSSDDGATYTDIADATENTYEFAVVDADNGTRYRAVFTNDAGAVTSAAATLTVATIPAFGTGTTLPTATVGTQYRTQITTSGRPKPTERVTAGSLPPGLRLVGDPVLTGTPTRAGSYRFTLTSTNTAGRSSRTFIIVVRAAPATSAPDPSTSDTPTGTAPTSSAATPATSSPAAAERATAQTGTDLVPTLAAGAAALLLGLVLVLVARRRRTQGRHHA